MRFSKHFGLLLFFIFFISCKEESKQSEPVPEDTEEYTRTDNFEDVLPYTNLPALSDDALKKTEQVVIKRQELIDRKDDSDELQELVTEKTFKRDEDLYLIDFTYPYLNEELKASYQNFNAYLEETYMDIAGVEADILEDKEMICDTLRINRFREKRLVDYKIYNLNENFISVLFYKELYFAGTLHPTYSFDCLNYDLERAAFMTYEDFFNTGTEPELAQILNEVLREKINSGELYYDCWEISFDDFFKNKNNFVLDDRTVEYFFDDCVICPSYTGTFSVEIPLERLLPVLRKYARNPLLL